MVTFLGVVLVAPAVFEIERDPFGKWSKDVRRTMSSDNFLTLGQLWRLILMAQFFSTIAERVFTPLVSPKGAPQKIRTIIILGCLLFLPIRP